jgi:isoaspartyl peptidase/L-asparaginase-like protein (Ntn-hydrolase superfamily)
MVMLHGMSPQGDWNVENPLGLARAVTWMERHVSMLADGAVWMLPRSMSIIHIDKTNKVATRRVGLAPEPSTQKVFEAMGWTWIDKAEP